MQIRELDLKELYIIYDILSQLYMEITYKEFEDLVYDMRHMDYKMIGIMDSKELITFAAVAIQTTFLEKRHLKVFDLITDCKHNSKRYDKMMKDYLKDYAKTGMCESVIY